MKSWVTAALLLALAACQPADRKTKTVKERLEAGEFVEFTKPGYRRPSCTERQPDWKDIRLSGDDERARIVVGKQQAALNPGKHSCFRVGSTVLLNSLDDKAKAGGRVKITKLAIVKIEKLDKRDLKGRFFASSDEFNRYKGSMQSRLRPDHEGIVTVVEFVYLSGSAADEKELVQKEAEAEKGDGFEETLNDGDAISKCGKPWMDIVVAPEFQSALLEGRLGSWYQLGDRNCLTQGQEAGVKTALGDASAVGKVKILKIKKLRVRALAPKYFVLPDFEYARLAERIQAELANRGSEWITIVDVQPLNARAASTVRAQSTAECLATGTPLSALELARVKTQENETLTVLIKGKTCFKSGELALLHVLSEDGKTAHLAVEVVKQEYREDLNVSVLEVKRVGFPREMIGVTP